MEKRYQVFVSSTFADLKNERQSVIQTLMEMDCIPSGMELFPAADEEQFQFIKKVIDDCDYYLLIIGGRYGSTTDEGISYTEKEFDYAVEKGLKVISFVHAEPTALPVNKTDNDPVRAARLDSFREKAMGTRLVKQWTNAEQLPGMVALSLTKTIKMHPAVGWVRANSIGSEELLNQLNELRIEKEMLQSSLGFQQSIVKTAPDIAGMDEGLMIRGSCRIGGSNSHWQIFPSWNEIFISIAPHLLLGTSDVQVKAKLVAVLFVRSKNGGQLPTFSDEIFQTIKIQLRALNLISLTVTDGVLFWALTARGEQVMYETGYVRTMESSPTVTQS
jgi:hypothetical protein